MNRAALLLAGLLTTGCYKIDYINAPSEPYPSETQWHHIGIFGLVEFSSPVRLDQICPQGWARVHNERSVLNVLVTLGLSIPSAAWTYQPYTTRIYCASGQGYEVQLDDDGLALSARPLED